MTTMQRPADSAADLDVCEAIERKVVERDDAHTVTLFRLTSSGAYAVAAQVPLAWLLRTDPAEHLS